MSLVRLVVIGVGVIGAAAYIAWQIYKRRQLASYKHRHYDGTKPVYFIQENDGTLSWEECVICLGDMTIVHKNHMLPCYHTFHESCIKLWSQYDRTCPLCRRSFSITR